MRYSKYVGDVNIELEGKPDEIIQVLKYLDSIEDKNKKTVIKDDKGNFVVYEDGSFTINATGIKNPVDEDVDLAIKIGDELVKMADEAVLNINNEIVLYRDGKKIGKVATGATDKPIGSCIEDERDIELVVKIGEDELVRKVVNTINKKAKVDNKGVCI